MKKASMILVAFALLTFGMVGCDRNDDIPDNPITPTDPSEISTGEWVDLGLPSGLLWANCNIGATEPEDYGDYFAWGETQAKIEYNWTNYAFAEGDDDGSLSFTKYRPRYNPWDTCYTDTLTRLEPMDDVATVSLGNGARMPTKKDFEELRRYTTKEWTTVYGVEGIKCTASNGNTIFLPAAKYSGGWFSPKGFYWTSDLHSLNCRYASSATFTESTDFGLGFENNERYKGFTVRAVKSPSDK